MGFLEPGSSLYKVLEWITNLVYLNLLWVFFTLIGLVVFGFMPSTLAMYKILKELLTGKENIKIFSTYWKVYKSNFIKINIIGLIMVLIGSILVIDLNFFRAQSGTIYVIINYFMYFLAFLYIMDFLYVFPVYINYDIKIRYILKNALFFVFLTPLENIKMIIGLILVLAIFYVLPSLIPFLGIALPVFVLSWVSKTTIEKVEEKVSKYK